MQINETRIGPKYIKCFKCVVTIDRITYNTFIITNNPLSENKLQIASFSKSILNVYLSINKRNEIEFNCYYIVFKAVRVYSYESEL